MIDPDILDEQATVLESIAAEMRSVAAVARGKGVPVPGPLYTPIRTESVNGSAPPPSTAVIDVPGTVVSVEETIDFKHSHRYPWSSETNREAQLKEAKLSLTRGAKVYMQMSDGTWQQYHGD